MKPTVIVYINKGKIFPYVKVYGVTELCVIAYDNDEGKIWEIEKKVFGAEKDIHEVLELLEMTAKEEK